MKVVVALAATASALVAPVAKVAPATVVDAKSAAMPFLECPAALDGLRRPRVAPYPWEERSWTKHRDVVSAEPV